MPSPLRDDRGSVTAEFAVALPAVVLVLAVALGALAAGTRAIALESGAGDAARMLGRGESGDRAAAVLHRAAPGARLRILDADGQACVVARVSAPILGPITVPLTARACALREAT
ncbi:TadE family type IV pilus minor pilin [Galbitalea soli]|uniref:Pilus assembly protein n=1 Tax=Galbitalea soli TaxID=1268042 RepID=A0A7C9PPC2_9MICO|nr:TadE family type IV pilus minor pilin [Galbitalea soli]NEM92190.1 hypothetical protein [Galbitalea soli]NYJ31856.1 hypothetical protein [Galbitalea soli]